MGVVEIVNYMNDTVASAHAVLAAFGARPSCGRHRVVFDDHACGAIHGGRDAFVIADRGGCDFADKALAVKRAGGTGLVVVETLDAEASSLQADARKVDAISDVVVVSVDRRAGARLRQWAGTRNLAARLTFDDVVCGDSGRDSSSSSSSSDRLAAAARAVRRAVAPNRANRHDDVGSPISSHGGGIAVKSGDLSFTALGLPHGAGVLSLLGHQTCLDLVWAVPDDDCTFALDEGAAVAVDLDACGAYDDDDDSLVVFDALRRTPAALAFLMPPPSDVPGLPPPLHLVETKTTNANSTKNVTSLSALVVSPHTSFQLRRALSDGGRLVLETIVQRPRLLRTWRELVRFREDSYDSSAETQKNRRRVIGALSRIVAPGGAEPDPDQYAYLGHACHAT